MSDVLRTNNERKVWENVCHLVNCTAFDDGARAQAMNAFSRVIAARIDAEAQHEIAQALLDAARLA